MDAQFTYTVLQYVHDPAAGEHINIGVLLCCPAAPYLDLMLDTKYEHLSHIFSDFNGDFYKQTLARFSGVTAREKITFESIHRNANLFKESELRMPPLGFSYTAEDVAEKLIPDNGFSFRFSQMFAGLTDNPERELQDLFDFFIKSQRPQQKVKISRTDNEIWTEFSHGLSRDARRVLRPHEVTTSKIDIQFEYAFQNKNWHIIQPMSMDYSDSEYIMMKAARWSGIGHAISSQTDVVKMYILLGKPKKSNLLTAYNKAKNLLHDIPIDTEFVEEDEIESWGIGVEAYMNEHGVFDR